MRILITGGAGYIGVCTTEELLRRGHDVTIFDTFYWGADPIDHLRDKVTIIEGDVRSSRDVSYALRDVELVVHLAGIVGDPACRVNPIAHYTENVESARTLVHCMTDRELNLVRDLIFASSCSVYGNVAGLYEEVVEETPTSPLSAYADGKLRAENIIRARAEGEPLFHPTILRLTTLFGWAPRPRFDLVTNQLAYRAVTEGVVEVHGDGQQYRSLVHVRDVAGAIGAVVDAPRYIRDRRVFHVGNELNNRTVRQIAEAVAARVEGCQVITKPGEAADRRDYKINCAKIRNMLNWNTTYTVEDGIRELVDNIRSSGLQVNPALHINAAYKYL